MPNASVPPTLDNREVLHESLYFPKNRRDFFRWCWYVVEIISWSSSISFVSHISAAIALEHHLGMSCDPVGGFVLIACIERNAFGAIKAYNAYLLATNEITSQHWEDLDHVIMAMYETGIALPARFKEMGTGGLGVTMVDC